MFVIRQARQDDAAPLMKLAKMVYFINLPPDLSIINRKILRSRQSFAGQIEDERHRQFMFILEDAETGNVIGTSSVMSQISWPGHPHTFLKVRRRELYSEDLQTGQVHVTLQIGTDESGPTEIGGLILSPSYRGHKERLGGLLSMVRFHFMGLNRKFFADRVIAEMMGAIAPTSSNHLWDYLGRRFINLDFGEADRFCQHSKEFIIALMPSEEIFVSLLPAEARTLIGRVGPETEPAKAMLVRLGFKDVGHIDPFDGGPYLEAHTDELTPVKNTTRGPFRGTATKYPDIGIVSCVSESGFRAIRTSCAFSAKSGIALPRKSSNILGATKGDTLGFTPLRSGSSVKSGASDNASARKPVKPVKSAKPAKNAKNAKNAKGAKSVKRVKNAKAGARVTS